ncbi:hypothetical protein MCUN1_001006 [Malassezia cuniculi]|uniref:COP9 signalosome complex subunit 1 n=1 Tax=Malassezia cuniculi TaxID=948313 RepID=A0AAF0J658_9BASI|nr:hypothetical protein MCUN1_001006 [Malassezia cuniculi]
MVGRDALMWDDASVATVERFSLEEHVGDTRGHARVHRLLYVAERVPSLRTAAASAAADTAKSDTRDIEIYQAAIALADAEPDKSWIEATEKHVRQEAELLTAELRMYENNMITESVRMGHNDLGDHYVRSGRFSDALVHYDKMREFSMSHEHVLEANLRAMYTAFVLGIPDAALSYADKAACALSSIRPAATPGQNESWRTTLAAGSISIAPRGPTPGGASIDALFRGNPQPDGVDSRAQISSRIAAMRTLCRFAACDLTKALPEVDAGSELGFVDIVPPAALAWYAVLGVLSDPGTGKNGRCSKLSEDAMFKRLSESDAAPRDILHAFRAGDMRRTLLLLRQHIASIRLDPIIGGHVPQMLSSITQRMLARYLSAYRRVSVGRLATVFGWEEDMMRTQLLELALNGLVEIQIDWPAQTVTVSGTTERDAVDTILQHGRAAAQMRDRLIIALKMEAAGHVVGA